MEKLLQWSIAQQSGDAEAIKKIGKPDEQTLGQLFGAPDEAALMKEAVTVAVLKESTVEAKEIALDNFEMMIENLDNANNIENLKLWTPLLTLLKSGVDDLLRLLVCGIIGIAVQNNPKTQQDFHLHPEGIAELISIAQTSENKTLVVKSLFAISNYIRNFKPGYEEFDKLNGWSALKLCQGQDKANLRVLATISAILSIDRDASGKDLKIIDHIKEHHLVNEMIALLTPNGNVNTVDMALNIIAQLAAIKDFSFSKEELSSISNGLKSIEPIKERLNNDDFNSVEQVK
ncbi:hsp70 nucleotide exchange factor fes1 [Scheffersomyces spartinae]|uniref:Hsp70 nucleotide exchange factor FES1 n=1 Tax=Scheffersomyces spartinae TaxID=45513 RepID=A0A9P7V9M7_9ASCO|nr:hsp70 nucleotide exchange factor fes1 [Scheffersomyces spartinae]KAG7193864.1 hsp70 nucleotide exchange factor fes1 [Scheffersomyces spartinae]